MVTVYFPKYLQNLTNGASHQEFETDSFNTVINGMRTLFPKLSMHMSQIDSKQISDMLYFIDKNTKKIVTNTINGKLKSTELVLIVTVYGQGGDELLGIGIGVALIASGFLLGPATPLLGMSFLTGGSLITTGISFVISGVLSALTPRAGAAQANTPPDSPIRIDNDYFEGFQNTTSTDMAIPLIYGQHRVGGQVIGGKIKTIAHDRSATISVASYV